MRSCSRRRAGASLGVRGVTGLQGLSSERDVQDDDAAWAQTDGVALSVIIATPHGFEPTRRLLRYLARQTVRERLELIFVVPDEDDFGLDHGELGVFGGYSVIEIGPFASVNQARVAGVRRAAPPLVVFTEDHCFPAPGWAEALIEAHKVERAAVGPVVGLANLHGARAWANYLIQYGPWMRPAFGGEVDDLPGHNSCYRKAALLEYGDELEELMEFEYVFHQDLRARGKVLHLEAAAETFHVFLTKPGAFCLEHLAIGQALAAHRARRFSLTARLLRLLATPLLPVVRTVRIWRLARQRAWHRALFPRILPWLMVGLATSALGELLGYAIGPGRAARWTLDIDFMRDRFVSQEERERIWGEDLPDFAAAPSSPTFGRGDAAAGD